MKQTPKESAKRAFETGIYRASWRSSGLGLNNAFSTTLVVRTAFRPSLSKASVIDSDFANTRKRAYSPLGMATGCVTLPRGWHIA